MMPFLVECLFFDNRDFFFKKDVSLLNLGCDSVECSAAGFHDVCPVGESFLHRADMHRIG